MANSFVRYTGNNSTTAYSIPFSYRSTADLTVTISGSATTAFTLNSAGTTLTFSSAPAQDAAIEIRRRTSQTSRLTDYASGSVLTENDLDTDSEQAFFMSQEAIDDAGDVIKLSNTNFQWDAQNKRLTNVANPTSNQDVATKHYLENTWLSASDKTNLTAVAGKATEIGLLGTSDAIADMNTLGTADVVSDMNTLANSDIISDLNTLATSDIVADMNTLATSTNVTNMATLAGISGLSTLAANNTNITSLAGKTTELGLLGTSAVVADLALLGTSDVVADMALLATSDVISDMNTLATSDIISDLNTLASSGIVEDLNILATSANVTAMGLLGTSAVVTDLGLLGTSANVTNMATLGTSANVTAMGLLGTSAVITDLGILGTADVVADMNVLATADVVADMNTLGTSDVVTDMNTLGTSTNVTNMSTVATNIAGVNSFADRYRVQAGVPSSSLNVGDLNFDTTANELKVYKSSGWASAGSTINGTSARFTYTATANQTTFTGADINGSTLAYDASFIDCYLNGVKLINGTDVTVTSGTSVVLATGANVGDTLDLVGYGTFNVASIAGTAINSGTIDDARLPTTMAGKTLNTAIVNANTLVARGDGSSADGKITLNCSQNTHGVKIQSPAHSAGQSYTLVLPTSVGTNGQVLATNGNATNQLSWINATETKPTVADVSQTIAPATATTISITGTNFVSIPIVEFIKTDGSVTLANTVAFTNATTLSVNATLASGNYYVRIENPDGNAGRSTNNILTASTAPTFSTSAGSLGSFAGNFSGTVATIAGSSDSTIAFSETTSVLTGAGVTLNTSTGALTTSDFGASSTTPTTYNFTIRITDAEGQTADRNFSFTSSFGATGGGQFN